MLDYKILEMHRHEDGYCVAKVRSNHTQEEYLLHDRWGSWMIGPAAQVGGREPAIISADLPAALQAHKGKLGDKMESAPVNPFIAKQKKAVNPFVKKAAKKNPMIAKLLKQGKIG